MKGAIGMKRFFAGRLDMDYYKLQLLDMMMKNDFLATITGEKTRRERYRQHLIEQERAEKNAFINTWYIENVLMVEPEHLPSVISDIYLAIFKHDNYIAFINENYGRKVKFYEMVQEELLSVNGV